MFGDIWIISLAYFEYIHILISFLNHFRHYSQNAETKFTDQQFDFSFSFSTVIHVNAVRDKRQSQKNNKKPWSRIMEGKSDLRCPCSSIFYYYFYVTGYSTSCYCMWCTYLSPPQTVQIRSMGTAAQAALWKTSWVLRWQRGCPPTGCRPNSASLLGKHEEKWNNWF